jgi:hypothetical protein
MEKLSRVGEGARELLQALNALDHKDRLEMVMQIIEAQGISRYGVDHSEFKQRIAQVEEEIELIAKLALLNPPKIDKRGQKKVREYLILKDAATIFRWFTGEEASRETSRKSGEPINDFWKFVSTLWPILFPDTGIEGLQAQVKNWVEWADQYNEGRYSALIANIKLRHPEWRVLEP